MLDPRFPAQDGVDFFISYTRADERWAVWIAWQLEAADYEVRVQAWDIRPGNNFVEEMDRAAKESRQTLAVLSPAYFASEFCRAEAFAAFRDDPVGRKRKLIGVRVGASKDPGLFSSIVYIDLVGRDRDSALEALLGGLAEERPKPESEPAFPGAVSLAPFRERQGAEPPFPDALPAVWTVPFQPNPHFNARFAPS
jgi:hypothetical protein